MTVPPLSTHYQLNYILYAVAWAAGLHNESLAGARRPTGSKPGVNALRDDSSITKYVQNVSELAAPGTADNALMAFQHRLCISGDPDRLPWRMPGGYRRDDFLLFERCGTFRRNKYYMCILLILQQHIDTVLQGSCGGWTA